MTTGRNATGPCGSGKKYKKCCLAKEEAAARAAEEQRQAEEAAQRAEREKQQEEWQQRDADKPPASPSESTVDGPDWPPLSDADQQLVDAWWKEAGPVYMGRDRGKDCGWLFDRVLAFLDQHPRLFRYLYLHEEFLFELGARLARAERMGDYLALLRRLRDEQPEMYFQCFGYYDEDLLTEALRTGRREEIPACLNLKDTRNERLHEEVGWSFAGWLRRTKGLTWSSARFLANALIDYWAWREDRKKPNSPYGLSEKRLDHYLAQRCRDFIGLNGVSALSTLQAFHYLTEYLVAHDYFNTADALRLQAAAGTLYETIRHAVDSCDSGYRICPTYEALIAAPPRDAEATQSPMPS